ncbi:hypothetical protein [Aurantimonas sp. NFXS3]|uniref:hypothetical protein n=1 Tax=Aurantimonas sp. NFXS3 TaxID=2818434 RepID=UPI003B8D8D9B
MKLRAGLLAVVVTASPASAIAVDESGAALVHIHGSHTCARYLQTYADEQAARSRVNTPREGVYYDMGFANSFSYVMGVMNGINMAKEGRVDWFHRSTATTMLVIKTRCEAEPTSSVPDVLYNLTVE